MVSIGLVNNMPDAALESTERQFRRLLSDAAQDVAVEMRVFSLSEIPRGEAGQQYVRWQCEEFDDGCRVDGLIVTGTEPRAPTLAAEPCWPALARLVGWAEEHTVSTIWSCLAAHAAVLCMDGIERRHLGRKLSGVYECAKGAEHTLLADLPHRWWVPHSRYNEVPEERLTSSGYQILSYSAESGADMFARQGRSLFVFMQGHLEYDRGALFREYRRDVGRFLAGESSHYPEAPRDYFDEGATAAFAEFRQVASDLRSAELMCHFPVIGDHHWPLRSWESAATRIYSNWLAHLAEVKRRRARRAMIAPTTDDRAEGRLAREVSEPPGVFTPGP